MLSYYRCLYSGAYFQYKVRISELDFSDSRLEPLGYKIYTESKLYDQTIQWYEAEHQNCISFNEYSNISILSIARLCVKFTVLEMEDILIYLPLF